MFQSLRYNNILFLELSPQSLIEFDIDFGRWVGHNHQRNGLEGDN